MTKVKAGILIWTFAALLITAAVFTVGCDEPTQRRVPVSNSGVKQARTTIETSPSGHTVEQDNIIKRYKVDNTPGSMKHLYIISPMSGQVILYSSVEGKVTSSGKRLTPKTVVAGRYGDGGAWRYGMSVEIAGEDHKTTEVIQDDGTYGDSVEYLYWFDTRGVYHQHYVVGCEIHISDQPIPVKNIILNLEEGHAK